MPDDGSWLPSYTRDWKSEEQKSEPNLPENTKLEETMVKTTKEKINFEVQTTKAERTEYFVSQSTSLPPYLQIMSLFLMVQENKNIIFLAFCLPFHSCDFTQLSAVSKKNEIIIILIVILNNL